MDEKEKIEPFDIQTKIEIATQTLERNMGLVSYCDTKASVVLAVLGAFLGFTLTADGVTTISEILTEALKSNTFLEAIYFYGVVFSAVAVLVGICLLTCVLFARGTKKEQENAMNGSMLFFGSIANANSDSDYSTEFKEMTKEKVLDALLKDLYINSVIAKTKYDYFNKGLKYAIPGLVGFIVLLMVGRFIY